ncbi:helix-turn-helix domain-containing protein [Spongiivirga sp. MCCC 1A20706]|uniref:helix-turn-helix domain-containing protein n=1 Tax=Spongiivirga sp. MCCC 1A20706 TaxID=3160963 RepID=UPI003977C716
MEKQLLFFFSALGAFNGLFLSVYFAFIGKKKNASHYFLSGLLFVISIRIIKSVFLQFKPGLSEVFIQVGLTACILIGPMLFLYVSSLTNKHLPKAWILHILIPLSAVITFSAIYPYWEFKRLWSPYFVKTIYFVWLLYIIAAGIKLRPLATQLIEKKQKLQDHQFWLLSVYFGVFFIWLGYNIGSFTSYIVGALSFSVVFYLIILFWVLKRKKSPMFFEPKEKYSNKKIIDDDVNELKQNLHKLLIKEQLFKNPNLKLNDVADKLQLAPHYLSQFLNDNLGKSFSLFINEYRIEAAKELLLANTNYTAEAIGYECGFNSKSTFFSTFKKVTGSTPSKYKG